MPVAFPSHQGLILPLWRRFPRALDGVTLSVGAAMPDVIETLLWPVRGELGQGLGHSLLGLVPCVVLGFGLAALVRRFVPGRHLARLTSAPGVRASFGVETTSLAVGALSHDVFDLVTHKNFVLLWPWCTKAEIFPAFWGHTWARIPLLVYKEPYPLAPHTLVWAVLSILGAVLFFRCLKPRGGSAGGEGARRA